MKICFYFTNDLMFTSRVKPFAVANGFEVRFPGFQEIESAEKPELVIFDLEFVSLEDLSEVMQNMKEAWPEPPESIAYAPHVKEAKLSAAKDAGVNKVWTRGQFNKNFESLFA